MHFDCSYLGMSSPRHGWHLFSPSHIQETVLHKHIGFRPLCSVCGRFQVSPAFENHMDQYSLLHESGCRQGKNNFNSGRELDGTFPSPSNRILSGLFLSSEGGLDHVLLLFLWHGFTFVLLKAHVEWKIICGKCNYLWQNFICENRIITAGQLKHKCWSKSIKSSHSSTGSRDDGGCGD